MGIGAGRFPALPLSVWGVEYFPLRPEQKGGFPLVGVEPQAYSPERKKTMVHMFSAKQDIWILILY